jgi:nucleoside phosphorylase
MEGYGIARAAQMVDLPCTLWKVVSDFCQEKQWNDLAQRLDQISTLLSQIVQEQLALVSPGLAQLNEKSFPSHL